MIVSIPTQPDWILSLASDRATLALAGGKGANLARLAQAGLPVPDGFVITTLAYQAFVDANGLGGQIFRALPQAQLAPGGQGDAAASEAPAAPLAEFEAASATIRSLFGRGNMPVDLAGQIMAAYARLGRPAVAVRSSATAEDLPEMSFAGQQDTYLNVTGDDALLRAVIDCWSSLWTGRAISYRARNGIQHESVSLAVVVQAMVDAEAAGVLFTANPLTGLRSETVIDATLGLGEALVAGQVEPDHYVVDALAGQIVSRAVGAKADSTRSKPGGGTVTAAEAQTGRPALGDEQILALAALGQRVADLYGAPQDIEWAWAQDTLHLLQARPVTSLYPVPQGLPPEPLKVLLSFGAVQGMLEPMTRLGRDVIYELIVAAAGLFGMRVTGATQTVLFTAGERLWINITPLLRNTAGRKAARVALPFVDPAAAEALAPIWDDPRLQPERQGVSLRARLQLARFLLPVAGNVALNLLSPHRRRRLIVEHGERLLDKTGAYCAALAGDRRARLAQLARLLPETVDKHVPRVFRLFVSGVASGMVSLNLLRVLIGNHPPGTGSLPGNRDRKPSSPWDDRLLAVTRGLPNNPTTEMDLTLWQVAQAIRGDADSHGAFQGQSAATLAAVYRAGSLPPVAQQALDRFMARYGSRGLAEIDIGRARWSEDPTHVMDVVAGYLQITPERAPDAVFARSAASAAAAADELVAAASNASRGWIKARLVRFAADRARGLLALRESPKFFAVRLFGLVRRELLRAGREFVQAGEVARPDDLFHLSFAELAALAAGETSPPGEQPGSPERAGWAGLIAERREACRREGLRRQVPRLLLSDGRALYVGIQAPGDARDVLAGSPVSPGSVVGKVRVVCDPRRAGLLPGEILVCPGTDPSWTPLFLTAAGLVMEVGGLMTHGAVVAREYGIPAVAGVDRATERLLTGQTISLNGSTGEIRLLEEVQHG